jgi:RNA polymerase primary sigma factor/RNA polymerase nonessential primary-like sigma factor
VSTTTTSDVERFREENAELFQLRTALHDDLEQLRELDDTDAAVRRRVRILRRKIDEVTSEIVAFNMGLVRSYTKRFSATASAQSREDFEAAGLLGLMRAVDSYDIEAGAFGQWAFQPIRREVLRAVRDSDHPNLNLGDFEKRPAIMRALRQLQAIDEAYRPSNEEVAALAGATVSQVRRVLAPPRLDSIHQTVGDDEEQSFGDQIPSSAPSPEATVLADLTLAALATYGPQALDEREYFVIVRRFGLDHEPPQKLADIGATLGLSREAVRQIESKALARLQHPSMLRRLQGTPSLDAALDAPHPIGA